MNRLLRDERAQDALEYLLAIGGFVVLLIVGLYGLKEVVYDVSGNVCPAVDTAEPTEPGDCIPTPATATATP